MILIELLPLCNDIMVDASYLKLFNKTATCSFLDYLYKKAIIEEYFLWYITLYLNMLYLCQVHFGWRPTPFISNDVLPPVVLKSNTNY